MAGMLCLSAFPENELFREKHLENSSSTARLELSEDPFEVFIAKAMNQFF
jgi:hypothetical protein